MNILVTGGAGFIGSHLAEHLSAAGHVVAALDDLSTGSEANLPAAVGLERVDLRDGDAVRRSLAAVSPEVVLHEAGQSDVRVSTRQPERDAAVNVIGGIHLLEACVAAKVRKVIYASTGGAVYGNPERVPVTEEAPVRPISQYGISKHTVEHYLYLYRNLYGLDYTVLRYPNVYGPRQSPRGEAGVISIFARAALRGEPVQIFGDGRQTRDYVYVSDIVAANLAVLADAGNGEIFNVGTGVGVSVLDIRDGLARALGRDVASRHLPPRPGEVSHIALDGQRFVAATGWSPTVGLDEGIRRTVEYVGRYEV